MELSMRLDIVFATYKTQLLSQVIRYTILLLVEAFQNAGSLDYHIGGLENNAI